MKSTMFLICAAFALPVYTACADAAAPAFPGRSSADEIARYEAGCEVPVVAGEIGRFMKAESERINPIIAECAKATPLCVCVSSEGLENRDKFHFNRSAAEELGKRYYAAWKRLAASVPQ